MKRMRKDNHPLLRQVPNAYPRSPRGSPILHSAPAAHVGLLPLGAAGATKNRVRRKAVKFVNQPTF